PTSPATRSWPKRAAHQSTIQGVNFERRSPASGGQNCTPKHSWNTRVTFGRIGCEGRTRRHDFESEADATAFIRACLRRRGTAEKRLSIRYRVIDASPSALSLLRIVGLEEGQCAGFAAREM
ncbi:MAG: hypothetical protein ACREFY_03365, partial [Acetobacteraceae bacterium]